MRKQLKENQLSNWRTYQMYLREMLTLAENVFEFENLPDYIDVAFLNKKLLRDGSIAFFKDEVLGVIALPYTVMGNLDIYQRPQKIMAIAPNGSYRRILNPDEYVIMYDNNGRYPLFLDITQYAERIALDTRTIDINILQQRTPRFWKTSSDKERSIRDIINNVDSLENMVLTYEDINLDDIQLVLEPAPYVADKIDIQKEKLWNEFLRLIGVANMNFQKKERNIKDEVMASQGGTIASRFSRFEPREKAIKLINEKFGTNIKVRYYDGIPTSEKDVIDDSQYLEESEAIEDV
jgi:hypothetical protein